MTDEEPVILYKKIGQFIKEHNREPKLTHDPLERRMGGDYIFKK